MNTSNISVNIQSSIRISGSRPDYPDALIRYRQFIDRKQPLLYE